jgi:seryl-tRNA synthetase
MKTWMPGPRPGMTVWKKAMHDIRFIREQPGAFDHALKRRGLAPEAQRLIALDEERRKKILEFETAQARRNAASKEIGEAKKNKNEKKAAELMAEVGVRKDSIPALEAAEKAASKALDDALAQIPNMPLDDVPDGKDPSGNVEHHRFGSKREYAFTPKQHFELGEAVGQMDFETAAKLSGARFVETRLGAARPRARAIHARSAYERAWLYGSRAAAFGTVGDNVWNGAIAEIQR